jgi:anthranilate synthase component 1
MNIHTQDTDLDSDALNIFEGLFDKYDNCFLLETLEDKYQPNTSGQSYIGVNPVNVFKAEKGTLYKDTVALPASNPYEGLRGVMNTQDDLMPGYFGGLVGFFGHESIQYIEDSLNFSYERLFPDFMYGLYTDGLICSPDKPTVYFCQDDNRLDTYRPTQQTSKEKLSIKYKQTSKDAIAYNAMVEKAHADILDGRVFQVVLANKFEYEFNGDILQLYRELRSINPSPFMFCIKFGDIITIGASPELLVHTNSDNKIYLEALAGTIGRGSTDAEDKELANQLLADEKELAEHSMLVDLARNDAGRISKIGSVEIADLMFIKKLSHVQHITSMISGTLNEGSTAFDALATSFTAGTLSGAPKIEAIKLISESEATERGPYGGTIGYFGFNGESVQAVNIRSLSCIGNKLFIHSGSGIVYDSTPEREAAEISVKKAAMDKAMGPFMQATQS